MAIDAVIERIRHVGDDLRLELAPRVERDGTDSIAGQPALTVLGPRAVEPSVGDVVWGSETIFLHSPGPAPEPLATYDRKGVRLREVRPCPNGCGSMHWADIQNTVAGETRECWRCGTCGAEVPL